MKNLDFYKSIRDFLIVYLPRQRGFSNNTVISYRQAINHFINYMARSKGCGLSDVGFDDLTYNNVINFLDSLQTSNHCSAATRNSRLYALRAFTKYVGTLSPEHYSIYMELSLIPVKKEERQSIDFIPENAIKSIFEQPDTLKQAGIRDLCFMILMYDTGARDREILDLTLDGLFLTESSPYVRLTGKGNKMRLVPIMMKTVSHLQKYLKLYHLHSAGDSYLFYTVIHGIRQQMSDDNVARFIKKYGQMAKSECPEVPDNLHPHMFRHARALHLYRNGMPLALVSEYLGHASLQSTKIYAYADTEMKRKAIQKARGEESIPDNTPDWQTDDELIRKLYGL